MRSWVSLLAISVALSLAFAATARADVEISSQSVDAASGKTKLSTLYLTADRLKVDTDKVSIIFRDDTGTIYTVMKDQRQYMAMDPAEQQRMGAMMSAMHDQMQQMLKSMPEAQRKQLEASGAMSHMMAQQSAPASPFESTGQSKTVGAWPCQVFRRVLGDGSTADYCIATLGAVGLTHEDLVALQSLADHIKKAIPQARDMGGMDFDAQTQQIGFEGIPVETVISSGGMPTSTRTVTSVKHAELPAGSFDIPAGNAKKEMPSFGARGSD